MAQAPLLNVVQVSCAVESCPPQAVRPDWEWRFLAPGSEGKVQRVPLLRITSTELPASIPPPPVTIIPPAAAESRILMKNRILSSTNNTDAS